MKLRFIFLSLVFLTAGQLTAQESKLTINNEFYGPVILKVQKSTGESSARSNFKGSPFLLPVGLKKELKFSVPKKSTVFVWFEAVFPNGSTYELKPLKFKRGDNADYTIDLSLFKKPLTSSSEKFFEELTEIFYSDINILEQDVENQRRQFLSLFGGLAIVKIDTLSGEKNRLNYLESGILGRTVAEGDVFVQNNIRNQKYIFKDSFLYKELNSRKNLIPGIKQFADGLREKGDLYEIQYLIKGLDNYISFQDSVSLEDRWYDINKELRNIFLEDYISAVERKEEASKIEVREYNRASGFQFMTVQIDRYSPTANDDADAVEIVTEDGPYYLHSKQVFQELLGDQILALGYDDNGIDHTEWIREKALSYLDELIKQRKPKAGSYLDKLNKLGIQGYYNVNQSEYLQTLRNIKADLLGEYQN